MMFRIRSLLVIVALLTVVINSACSGGGDKANEGAAAKAGTESGLESGAEADLGTGSETAALDNTGSNILIDTRPLDIETEDTVTDEEIAFGRPSSYNNIVRNILSSSQGGTETTGIVQLDPQFSMSTGSNRYVQVSAGSDHTCGIRENGHLYCWGNEGNGRLGNGSMGGSKTLPVEVSDSGEWKYVSAGNKHTCAINLDDYLFCWGRNDVGQLGNGSYEDSSDVPLEVTGEDTWISVSAGYDHTCGIKSDQHLFCWGNSYYGQLGIDIPADYFKTIPNEINGGGKWIDVSAGLHYSCAIKIDGNMFCWGRNDAGQLGTGGFSVVHTTPQNVTGEGTWLSVSAGTNGTCGIKSDYSLFCWGTWITLGVEAESASDTPIEVNAGFTWKSVSVKGYTAYGITDSNDLYYWGDSQTNNRRHLIPTIQPGSESEKWKFISAGKRHSCGINVNDELYCWGENGYGQIGNGDKAFEPTPQEVAGGREWNNLLTGTLPADIYGISSGDNLFIISPISKLLTIFDENNKWLTISQTYTHICGIHEDGHLYCWGGNDFGQIGIGTFSHVDDPALVARNDIWSSVSTGKMHTCGIKSDGHLFCWGNDEYGQLGYNVAPGLTELHQIPQIVEGDSFWTKISAGSYHTCGIKSDRHLFCWGSNSFGKLGNDSEIDESTPVEVSGSGEWKYVSARNNNTCGIKTNGRLFCWGSNSFGKLGIGNGEMSNSKVPSEISYVPGHNMWFSVSVGDEHTCAVNTFGVYCWGENTTGQLGDGTFNNSSSPVSVAGGVWKNVSTGSGFTCGVRGDGKGFCWGNNYNGHLATGRMPTDTSTPQRVLPPLSTFMR